MVKRLAFLLAVLLGLAGTPAAALASPRCQVHGQIVRAGHLRVQVLSPTMLRVEYSATFQMIKPVDMAGASGLLSYLVVNRGTGAPGYFPEGHVGLVSADDAIHDTVSSAPCTLSFKKISPNGAI